MSLMRAVEQALQTKRPLPQFLPSARIAHLRLINAVRAFLIEDIDNEGDQEDYFSHGVSDSPVKQKMLRRQFMGWSAISSALEEIIEYVEGKN